MGKSKPSAHSNIVKYMCSSCRANVIYIKVMTEQNHQEPFKANDYTCTECNQSLVTQQQLSVNL